MTSNPVNSNLRHRFHGIQRAPPVPLVNVRDRQQINQNRKGRKPMYSNSRETAIELAKVPEAKKNEFKRDTIRDVVAIVKLAKKITPEELAEAERKEHAVAAEKEWDEAEEKLRISKADVHRRVRNLREDLEEYREKLETM